MRKLFPAILVLLVFLSLMIIGAGCYQQQLPGENITSPQNETMQNISQPPQKMNNEITIMEFAFTPSELTISKGEKVTWINEDELQHTVTSDSGALFFDFIIVPGDKAIQYFNIPGTYNYHCKFHPSMKGKIIVE